MCFLSSCFCVRGFEYGVLCRGFVLVVIVRGFYAGGFGLFSGFRMQFDELAVGRGG